MESIDGMMPFDVPGVGLAVLVILIPLTGFFTSNYLGKKLFQLIGTLFNRMSVVKLVYSAVKDMVEAFVGDRKSFDQPVLVEPVEYGPKA